MRATEEWRAGLVARLRGAHALWQRAVTDLTLAHVNHVERPGVLPIAFSLLHYVAGGEDKHATRMLRAGPRLWDAHAPRVGVEGELPGRGTPMALAEKVRIKDMDAWRAYQTAVFERTERALAALPLSAFDELLFDGKRPEDLKGGFMEVFVPEGPISVAQGCEAYLYQHAVRHLGELDHARGLVGLRGVS